MRKIYQIREMFLAAVLLIPISFTLYGQNLSAQQLVANNRNQVGFEENKGQVTGEDAKKVKYVYRAEGVSVFLMNDGLTYVFTKVHDLGADHTANTKVASATAADEVNPKKRIETYRMDVQLVGANKHPKISTEGKSKDYIQYYNHNVLDVHNYSKVTYHNVYPNIDWVVVKNADGIKYDFVVHPGGNPNRIKLQTKWAENIRINKDGSLTLSNRMGKITEKVPVSFQGDKEIKTAFVMDRDEIQFQLADYDQTKTLIIDPALIWGTVYGGPGNDHSWSVTTDVSGNIFMSGTTLSGLLIASGGYQNAFGGDIDAFLVKFTSSGVRLWATYYGGSNYEDGRGCATDSQGNIYLGGNTTSFTNISFNGHQNSLASSGYRDAFLVKFDANGNRLWATYYGGSGNDRGFDVCVDPSDNVYLVGETPSTNNISFNGHKNTYAGGVSDVFIVKFNPDGTRLWGSYYGGSGRDDLPSCTTDQLGNVYMSGITQSGNSGNAIAFNGFQQTIGGGNTTYSDAFLVKFNSSGTRLWSTYFGGSNSEDEIGGPGWGDGFSIISTNTCRTDSQNNVYLVGTTKSNNLPVFGGAQTSFGGGNRDAYLVKIDPNGAYLWGTYFGGTKDEYAFGCVDANDNFFMAGGDITNYDLQYTKFLPNGSVDFTYALPNGSATINDCIAGDNNTIYITGSTNTIQSLVLNGHQLQVNGMRDGFLIKVSGNGCAQPSQPGSISGNTTLCAGTTQTYSVTNDAAATSYTWNLPNGWSGTSATNSITVTAGTSGGSITVTANNACGSSTAQTLTTAVNTTPAQPSAISGNNTVCAGATQTYNVTNDVTATNYTWTLPGGWSGTSATNSITATAGASGGSITVTANNGCGSSAAQTLATTVNTTPAQPSAISGNNMMCSGTTQTYSVTNDVTATNYTWTLPSGWSGTSTTNSITATAGTTGGSITVTANNACGSSTAQTLTTAVNTTPAQPSAISGNNMMCAGATQTYNVTNDVTATNYTWILPNGWSGTSTTNSIAVTAGASGGSITVTANNACGSSAAQTLNVTVHTLPAVIATGTATICSGTTAALSASGANAYTWNNGAGTGASVSVSPGSTTTYTVTGTDANMCSNTAQVTVTVNALPSVGYTQNPALVCVNYAAFALTGGTPSGGVYSGAGVGAGNFNPGVAGIGAHTITYSYTDANNCSNTATQVIEVDGCAGIDEQTNEQISVYPNPFTNDFTVSFATAGVRTMELVDVLGKQVRWIKIDEQHTVINTADLCSGTYYLKVTDGNLVLKLVKN